ncbi:MAG TPA: serine--tRNA ligase [Candidatus Saccharimonadales bacterium]|nr:serine--tRNA ligase [Candidatus Saccharimonadales bacterium]
MRPIDRIRADAAGVRAMLEARGFEAPLDRIIALDVRGRELRSETETLRADRNKASKGGPPTDEVKARMRAVGTRIAEIDKELAAVEAELAGHLDWIPNVIAPGVPTGRSDADNVVVRQDEARPLAFPARPHWEIGEILGILDIPRGTKLSGSRFYVLRGAGAALQRALITWMLDLKIEAGFIEIYPPFVTRRETLQASAHLPHFDENLYRDEDDDLWLIPTAEPQLVSLHRDETIPFEQLPARYVAYTACFRREHMSAGRDVRGIKRGHQFDKVEMVVFCVPEDSPRELDLLTGKAVEVLERLEIPARVVERCSGDLGFVATKGFDVEAWAPGAGEWLEVSSCSDGGSLQAERAGIRFKREAGAKPEHPHILNASGLALPRLLIAVLENYQQPDGSVLIPPVLRPYLHDRERIAVGEFSL